MKPPETDLIGFKADAVQSPAEFSYAPLTILTQRRDFQRASRGKRVAMDGFILQMQRQAEGDATGPRVGYTCSKKVGNAVARNRAKRRLREIARAVLAPQSQPGHDYVLIGRKAATANLPFLKLLSDLEKAVNILHGARK